MPIFLRLLALPLLFAAAPAVAQSPFDGTWKADLASMNIQSKPDSFRIKDGTYSCSTCIPAYSVPADGKFHAVKGKDYWDDVAVTVVDDRTVKFAYRKAGKQVSDGTVTVSADGGTLTRVGHDVNNGGNVPIESKSSVTRVGTPVAGAHLVSGEWQPKPASSVSDAAITMTMAVKDGMLHLTSGLGETLHAKIGGDYALTQGDPGKTMTKVEQPAPNALRLTDMRSGKLVQVSTYTVVNGVLKGEWRDPQTGAKGTFTARKQ